VQTVNMLKSNTDSNTELTTDTHYDPTTNINIPPSNKPKILIRVMKENTCAGLRSQV